MYKSPLHIFVVWHPKFKGGQKYAEHIYSYFTRNVNDPLARGVGIPVFFRSVNYEDEPITIDLNQAENNAIVLLIEDKCILNWKEYINGILTQVEESKNENNRIFPVSITSNFSRIGDEIAKRNFIRLHTVKGNVKSKASVLLSHLTHELSRLLLDKPRISGKENSAIKLSPEPISLFISHAKRDGVEIAEKIKSYADANKPIKSFFDRIDIASGYKFGEELEGNIEKSALLVIQTDAYSSREWCRWEVLKAKKRDKPVVVINAVEEGEERSFPYLGNVPTIRWKNLSQSKELKWIERILDYTLYEILRYTYTYRYLTSLKGLTSLTGTRSPKILSSPPELLTLLEKSIDPSTKGKIIIYPDPPLTAEEMKLLSEISEDYLYLTPTFLLAQNEIKANEKGQ